MKLQEHLEKLSYFYEVANCKSMKKAAQKVFITQPSLSKSMKLLEEVIGHDLFVRLPRGVRLTPEGETLYSYCHELFSSLEDLEKKLDHGDDPMAGTLRIGTYDSIGIYFWPSFLREFLPKYPNLTLELTTGRSSQMRDKLERGEIDIALIVRPKASSQLEVKPISKDVFKFYEAAKGKKVYKNLEDAPLILMGDSFSQNTPIDEILTENGLANRKVYQTSSLESAKELCLNGLGVGLLPEFVAADLLQRKKIKEVKFSKMEKGLYPHDIGVIIHKSKKDSILVNYVIESIEKDFHMRFPTS